MMGVLAVLGVEACGAGEPLPAYPPPLAPADQTAGGDLDSLLEEEDMAPSDEAAPGEADETGEAGEAGAAGPEAQPPAEAQ
jgi:hypothetical protein